MSRDNAVTSRQRQLSFTAVAMVVVVAADQLTKAAVRRWVEEPVYRRDEDVFFHITHHENTGLVGGALSDVPIVAYVAPPLATLLLVFLFRYLDPASRVQAIAFGMVLGGAIGNFIDRIRLQAVTDFLQVHFYFIPFDFPWKYFPAFNVADASITVGVAALLITWNIPKAGHATDSV